MPVVLKSEGSFTATDCDPVVESSVLNEQATIEAVSIEFIPSIKEDKTQVSSSVTLEAAGKHDPTKVSVRVCRVKRKLRCRHSQLYFKVHVITQLFVKYKY